MERARKVPLALLTAALAALLASCGETKLPSSKQVETKPQVLKASDATTLEAPKASLPVIRAQYRVRINTKNGLIVTDTKLCDGMATLLVNEREGGNYDISLTDPHVKCLGDVLDLSVLLAGLLKKDGEGSTPSDPTLPKPKATAADGLIAFDRIFGALWSPSRPVVVGPLVQNPSQYQGLDKQNLHVLVTDGADPKTTSGTLRVRVHETRTTLRLPLPSGKQLDSIMHWSMTSEGFRNVKRAKHFLFDDFHVYVNTRPIVVAKITIESSFDDLIGGGAVNGFGGFLMKVAQGLLNVVAGRAQIELEATDWNAQ